jgi:hypothetical protein
MMELVPSHCADSRVQIEHEGSGRVGETNLVSYVLVPGSNLKVGAKLIGPSRKSEKARPCFFWILSCKWRPLERGERHEEARTHLIESKQHLPILALHHTKYVRPRQINPIVEIPEPNQMMRIKHSQSAWRPLDVGSQIWRPRISFSLSSLEREGQKTIGIAHHLISLLNLMREGGEMGVDKGEPSVFEAATSSTSELARRTNGRGRREIRDGEKGRRTEVERRMLLCWP